MAQVVYSPTALANLADVVPDAALASVRAITTAVEMLEHHPLVGRIVRADLRELVISFGRSGYVALYRFLPGSDVVRVLAIRHQRQLDYAGD